MIGWLEKFPLNQIRRSASFFLKTAKPPFTCFHARRGGGNMSHTHDNSLVGGYFSLSFSAPSLSTRSPSFSPIPLHLIHKFKRKQNKKKKEFRRKKTIFGENSFLLPPFLSSFFFMIHHFYTPSPFIQHVSRSFWRGEQSFGAIQHIPTSVSWSKSMLAPNQWDPKILFCCLCFPSSFYSRVSSWSTFLPPSSFI